MSIFTSFMLGLLVGSAFVAILLKYDFKALWSKIFKKKE